MRTETADMLFALIALHAALRTDNEVYRHFVKTSMASLLKESKYTCVCGSVNNKCKMLTLNTTLFHKEKKQLRVSSKVQAIVRLCTGR